MVANLQRLTGGRFLFGIGAGWNEPECTVLGGDFAHRWTQTKESIMAMKALWTGEYVEHHGKYFDFPRVICQPVPARKPHPPILLGSIGSPRVFKRVVEWGDGWLPFSIDPQEIADGRAELNKLAAAAGRDPASVDVTMFAPDTFFRKPTEIDELAKAGADGVVIWLQGGDEQSLVSELEDLAGSVFG